MTLWCAVLSTLRGWTGGGGTTLVGIAVVETVCGIKSCTGALSEEELSEEKFEKVDELYGVLTSGCGCAR